MRSIEEVLLRIKVSNPDIYGIDWDNDESDGKIKRKREREKPFCEIPECNNRVSTEFGRPKPYCKDHVFENPYVKDLLLRMEQIDPVEDRKRANEVFQKMLDLEEQHSS